MLSSPGRSYLPPQPLNPKPAAWRLAPVPRTIAPVSRSQMSPNGSTITLAKGARLRAASAAALIGRDQPHRFARAAGMDRIGERRDFGLRGRKVVRPQLGMARETDPNRFVRRPFGKRGCGHPAPPIKTNKKGDPEGPPRLAQPAAK